MNDTAVIDVLAQAVADLAGLTDRVERLEALLLSDSWVPAAIAARRLGIPRTTLVGWLAAGSAPGRKIGHRWQVEPSWFAAQLVARGVR